MTNRDSLTPLRKRRTVAHAPTQDRFPDSSAGPAKAPAPAPAGISRRRPTLFPEPATDPVPPTPGNRAIILSP